MAVREWLERNVELSEDDSIPEERINAATHGAGVALAIAATVLLVRKSIVNPQASLAANLIYGLSMVLLYGASTTYHAARDPLFKRATRILDHLSIFVLIAGTYTAALATIDAQWTSWILVAVWALAATGGAATVLLWKRFKAIHVGFYLAMGWLIVIKFPEVLRSVSNEFLIAMIVGGLCYTVGTIAYALRRVRYHHALWHLLVLAGSAGFFVALYWFS